MPQPLKNFDAKEWYIIIILMLFLTDVIIFLDVPILRQVIGFLFLTLLPGLLIIEILRLNKIGSTEKFVLLVGLSISFLMFSGLLLNNLSLSLGYETPLAFIPLMTAFNVAFIVLAVIGYKTNKNTTFSLPNIYLTTSEKVFLIVSILLPALSIFGMHLMNTTDNNIILMFLLFLIPIYVALVCFFNHKFPNRLYPIVIFLISISLLLLLSLRSNHLIGIDTHLEYYYFQTTLNNLHWSAFGHSTLDACLAISLLPTMYQSILNISPEFLFKVLFSLIYSIAPLVIYIISKKYVRDYYAFLAACFFMFQINFLFTEYNARTNTAVLFFALAMMVFFSEKIDSLKKRILFIVFMASCIVSHYSTTYIFFFIMLGAFIGMEILSKKYTIKKAISLTVVVLFFAFIFFWYSQITGAAFEGGVYFIKTTFSSLSNFFLEEARSKPAQLLLGGGIEKGIPDKIKYIFTWITFAYIGIGIITLIKRYKEMSFPELDFKKPDFLKEKFEVTYFMIALACVVLLVAMVMLPFVSVGYGIERLYAIAITILSVFFVIGGVVLSRHLKVRAYLIILLVLIPYFLCVTGVMYNIFGVPRAIILNSEGEQYDMFFVHDQDSYAGEWFGKNYIEERKIYAADMGGALILRSQGGIYPITAKSLSEHEKINGYIYLRYYNIVNGKIINSIDEVYNMTEYSHQFVGKSEIYDNGGSKIYRG